MSEFNGKKFYGFSLHNDPALLTNTRNFEFRYMRPDTLERAIQKVQLGDGANAKQKKTSMLNKYCKLKKPPGTGPVPVGGPDERPPYQGRDVDVETHISRRDGSKVRDLSATEVDLLIGKAKSTVELIAEPTCGDHLVSEGMQTEQVAASLTVEEVRLPEPKWVQIEERPRFVPIAVADLKRPVAHRGRPEAKPRPTMWLSQSEGQPLSFLEPVNYADMARHAAAAAYEVEDSDYEYEMLGRPDYTKFCGQRPREDEMTNVSTEGGYPQFIEIEPNVPCMDLSFLKNASPLRYSDLTDEYVEEERVESTNMKIFIKNPNQSSDKSDAKPAEKKSTDTKKPSDKKPTAAAAKKKPSTPSRPTKAADRVPNISPRSKYSKFSPESPRARPKSPRERHNKAAVNISQHHHQHSGSSNRGSPRSRQQVTERSKGRLKNIVLTKSLEDLKLQKMSMFSKMTATQERIIETLDKLRMSLLEIVVPDSSYEKNRRQKNAFEFSVRFSRNFLYPLKGMLDDLRSMTPEQLNSSSTNDACGRVANIYILLLQSLRTYHKQLRFFLLDQVPQKLTTLIEMMHTATGVCLEKGIFDRNDPIVDCLQERCTKFLGFLQDLHEERFQTARENYCKLNFDKKPSVHHGKYDLKMFMNNLNMYEPKLVPKPLRHHHHRNASPKKRLRAVRPKKPYGNEFETSSDMVMTRAAEDAVSTQMQAVDPAGSSKSLMTSMQNLLHSSNDQMEISEKTRSDPSSQTSHTLNKAVIEALQLVTKEQVRQVLEPIIQSLGTTLDKENNSETIETILKDLNRNLLSMTRAERKTRRGTGGQRGKWSKVPGAKVAAGGSTSSTKNATTASKAAKQTETRAETRQHRTDVVAAAAAATASNRNNHNRSNNSGICRSRTRDDDERDEAVAEDSVDEGEAGEPDYGEVDVGVGDDNRSESESASDSECERGRSQFRMMVGLRQKLQEEYREEQLEQQQEEQRQQEQRQQRELQLHQLELQQLQMRQRQQQHHEQQQQQNPVQSRHQSCSATSTVSLATATTPTSTASAPCSEETLARPLASAHRLPPCHKNKSLLFKRRRTPLLPPPPVPAGTPSTSARSARTDNVALVAAKEPATKPSDVEELPHAMTNQNSSYNNNRQTEAEAAERMTSRNQHEREPNSEAEASLAPHAATENGASCDRRAAKAAIAAAFDSNELGECGSVLNRLCSSMIADVLANCLANPTEVGRPREGGGDGGVCIEGDDDEDDDEDENDIDAVEHGGQSGGRGASGADGEVASYVATRRPRVVAAAAALEMPRERGDDEDLLSQHCAKSFMNRMLQHQQEKHRQPHEHQDQNHQQNSCHPQQDQQHHPQQQSTISPQLKQQHQNRRPLNEIGDDQNPQHHQINYGNPLLSERTCDGRSPRNAPEHVTIQAQREGGQKDSPVGSMLRERDHFLSLCSRNLFYANPNYSEPWKVFSRISEMLATEVVNSVEEDFTIGVSRFVQDFLEMETQI